MEEKHCCVTTDSLLLCVSICGSSQSIWMISGPVQSVWLSVALRTSTAQMWNCLNQRTTLSDLKLSLVIQIISITKQLSLLSSCTHISLFSNCSINVLSNWKLILKLNLCTLVTPWINVCTFAFVLYFSKWPFLYYLDTNMCTHTHTRARTHTHTHTHTRSCICVCFYFM
jgi:hypothetical protein